MKPQLRALLRVARAAWKVSDEISEFGQVVGDETLNELDIALMQAFGVDDWLAVRGEIDAAITDAQE